MIRELKPYQKYSKNNPNWTGKLPSHWNIQPNRALFVEIKERDMQSEEMLSVTIRHGVIKQKTLLENTSKKDSSNLDKSKYKMVRVNDIAYNKMRAWQGSLGVSLYNGIVSPAYVVLRLRNNMHNPFYFHYLYRTGAFAKEAERWSYGITSDMWSLRPEHFRMIYSPVPPLEEQNGIVRFLNWFNKKIDQILSNKKKIVSLIDEEKQTVIQKIITTGIYEDVELKETGVPWLGRIPKNWYLKRFKFVATINSGQVDPRLPKFKNMPLIAPNHIEQASGRLLNLETADEQGADSGKYMVKKGQIIYSKIRPNLRKATIAPNDCLCSADMYPISPSAKLITPEYLLMLMLSKPFTKYAVDCSMRVAMPKINREALGNCYLWFPPIEEQSRILEYIAEKVTPYNRAIDKCNDEIKLFLELKTTMAFEVTTGKIDIRSLTSKYFEDKFTEMFGADEYSVEVGEDESMSKELI